MAGPGGSDGAGARWRLRAVLVGLAALYMAVIALGDSRTYNGSDAGGRAATARVVAEAGTCTLDVGYWARAGDPEAVHHQLINTERQGDEYVQATSVPFACAAGLLWDLGGPALALALPVLGALGAAAAAAGIARRLGGSPELAALVVGLGPVAVFGADLWEHAPATGLVLGAVHLALRPVGVARALLIGVLLGLAGVLRAEAVVVGAGLAVALLVVPERRRRWLARPAAVVAGVVGALGTVGANQLLERSVVEGSVRSDRASGLASQAGDDLSTRLRDALSTTANLAPVDTGRYLAMGAVLLVALVLAGGIASGRLRLPPVPSLAVCTVIGVLYLDRAADGLSFVPGALTVAPLAAAGLWAARDPDRDLLRVAALVPVVPILLLQWRGNQLAQWGGRYLMPVTAILVVVGVASLRSGAPSPESAVGDTGRAGPAMAPVAAAVLVVLSLGMGAWGLRWHVERSNTVGDALDRIEALAPPDAVVVSTVGHLGREAGAWYGDRRWLTAAPPGTASFDEAIALARRSGADQVLIVAEGGAASCAGRCRAERLDAVGWFGRDLDVLRARL